MIASLILHECEQRGLRLWVDGDKLRFKGAPGVIPSPLLETLRQHKTELIGLLAASGLVHIAPFGPHGGPDKNTAWTSANANALSTPGDVVHMVHISDGYTPPIQEHHVLTRPVRELNPLYTRNSQGFYVDHVDHLDVNPCEATSHNWSTLQIDVDHVDQTASNVDHDNCKSDTLWATLRDQRWGPGLEDDTPGIDVVVPGTGSIVVPMFPPPPTLPPTSLDDFTEADINAIVEPLFRVLLRRRMGYGTIHTVAMDCFSQLVNHLDDEQREVFHDWIEIAIRYRENENARKENA
jgi:hypothetical protein